MHMADALLSPAVGGVMWGASMGIATYSIKKVQDDLDERKIPLMGVMGAFVFAAQMINFSIPGTGSSGHIGGGMLLATLLGPYAGFLTMASILLIQALFFADGGLLALGSNIFNLGFYTCFIAYPLVFKGLMRRGMTSKRIFIASIVASVVGLQLGSFSVVLETLMSGKTELPFGTFALLMQPIHLAIGAVEGFVTASIAAFIWQERPEILEKTAKGEAFGHISLKKILAGFVIGAMVIGGGLSWFASSNPDGLEWSMAKTAGTTELEASYDMHKALATLQSKTSFLPDYGFKTGSNGEEKQKMTTSGTDEARSVVSTGTSVSGLVGGGLTLVFAVVMGLVIRIIKRRKGRVIA